MIKFKYTIMCYNLRQLGKNVTKLSVIRYCDNYNFVLIEDSRNATMYFQNEELRLRIMYDRTDDIKLINITDVNVFEEYKWL